ncbi:MAG: PKD domain-containing protein [Ktedonobacterales bacterium]|nr:PKD domain-containing protein [Ktedonobacterales bacterium]
MRTFGVKLLASLLLAGILLLLVPLLRHEPVRPARACGLSSTATMTANGQPALAYPLTPDSPPTTPVGLFGQQYALQGPIAFTEDLSRLPTPVDPNTYRWTWDFGDGTLGHGFQVTHTYAKAGTYDVRLQLVDPRDPTNSDPNFDSAALTVLAQSYAQPPIAHITSDGIYVQLGSSLTYDANGSYAQVGGKVSYTWNFGDSTIDQGMRVTHTFSIPGQGFVALIVQDARGARTVATTPVFVALELPTARVTASATSANIGQSLTFDASGSTPTHATGDALLSYRWTFGTGSPITTTTPTITHTFTKAGDYTVKLEAINKDHLPGTALVTVYIGDPGFLGLGSHAAVILGGFGGIFALLALAMVVNLLRERRLAQQRLALAAQRRAERARRVAPPSV